MIQRESPGPVRTCIGCRRRELAVGLLRVVTERGTGGHGDGVAAAGAAVIVVDTTGNLPGRGAWLHPDGQCLAAAVRRRAFARALRITGSPDTSAVVAWFGASGVRIPVAAAPTTRATEQVAKNMSTP